MADLSLFGGAGFGDAVLGAVVIDGGDVYFDDGALHGRSRVESDVRFVSDRNQLGDGARRVLLVWVAVKPQADGQHGYIGLADSELWVDHGQGLGYKPLTDHANRMGDAVGGRIRLDRLSAAECQRLQRCLQEQPELWQHASAAVRATFTSAVAT